jgi:hypothetical protein
MFVCPLTGEDGTKMDGKVVEISEVGAVRSRNGRARRSCFDPTVADITIVDCQRVRK